MKRPETPCAILVDGNQCLAGEPLWFGRAAPSIDNAAHYMRHGDIGGEKAEADNIAREPGTLEKFLEQWHMAGNDRGPSLLIHAVKGQVVSIFGKERAVGFGVAGVPGRHLRLKELTHGHFILYVGGSVCMLRPAKTTGQVSAP